MRGAPPAALTPSAGPESVWYVDVTKGGSYCVVNPSSLILWRPNRDRDASAKLTSAAGKSAAIAWKKGSSVLPWPTAQLPVSDGASYTFSDPVGPSVKITTRLLGTLPADEIEIAGMLGDRGCHAQLDVLANAAAPSAPSGGR